TTAPDGTASGLGSSRSFTSVNSPSADLAPSNRLAPASSGSPILAVTVSWPETDRLTSLVPSIVQPLGRLNLNFVVSTVSSPESGPRTVFFGWSVGFQIVVGVGGTGTTEFLVGSSVAGSSPVTVRKV